MKILKIFSEKLNIYLGSVIDKIYPEDEKLDSNSDVDVVITWVDGADPLHAAKLQRELFKINGKKIPKASKTKRRFSDNEELRYCIRSIRNYAPWVRTIWLLTDRQFPSYLNFWAARSAGIKVVTHKQIFFGIDDCLPTFNSLSIESFIWRIPGLSEKFIYFNDDVFLSRPVEKEDFFSDKVVLRGRYLDLKKIAKPKSHFTHQLNAFRMLQLDEEKFFSPAHFPHALRKSVMEEVCGKFGKQFIKNTKKKFRDDKQFWPIALVDYYMVEKKLAKLDTSQDGIMLSVAKCKKMTGQQLVKEFEIVENRKVKFFCINFMEEVESKVPDLHSRLDKVCGPRLPFERN